MLEKLGMEFVGHPHCGLDDATNIAHLLIRMITDGASVDINERIQLRYKLDPPPKDDETKSSNQVSLLRPQINYTPKISHYMLNVEDE